jgi:hypothetical protein
LSGCKQSVYEKGSRRSFISISFPHYLCTEFYGEAGTGFFSFSGKSAVKSSFIVGVPAYSSFSFNSYTNDIYGHKKGLGASFGVFLQRVTKYKLIFGLSTGGEILKSKVPIDKTSPAPQAGEFIQKGTTVLTSKFINIRPFAGYRIAINNYLSADITGNIDFAFCTTPHHEKGSSTVQGPGPNDIYTLTTDLDRNKTGVDVRLGFQLRINYKRYGLIAGYWAGQSNYYKDIIGANLEAYSRLVRAGISYRLNK